MDRANDAASGYRRGGDGDWPEPAPIAVKSVSGSPFESWIAVITVLCIGLVAVFTRGMVQRLLILVGLIVACLIYALLANVFGFGKPVDFTLLHQAAVRSAADHVANL